MAKKKVSEATAWLPPGFDLKKSYALKAVIEGRADSGQQTEAIRYIVRDLAGLAYQPEDLDSINTTYYNLGRQVVGRGIDQIAKLNLGDIAAKQQKQEKQ